MDASVSNSSHDETSTSTSAAVGAVHKVTPTPTKISSLQHLNNLLPNLSSTLQERIVHCPWKCHVSAALQSFVLYLPTVNLRMEHNPSFALACSLANAWHVPVIVLAVVGCQTRSGMSQLQQQKKERLDATVMTARRLAFTMEALQECCSLWSNHGAAVFVRVHGNSSSRAMEHLSLAVKASAVVLDEAFVRPYSSLVEQVEGACRNASRVCYRVDGSTTVPPCSILKRCVDSESGKYVYSGIPDRAWKWNKMTQGGRERHLDAALCSEFDAPTLLCPVNVSSRKSLFEANLLHRYLPSSWVMDTDEVVSKPLLCSDLNEIPCFKKWAVNFCGDDKDSPHPCKHTTGNYSSGMSRWSQWLDRGGLKDYARTRNDPKKPHSPSRMSCYLNLGIVSIFRLISDMDKIGKADKNHCSGIEKYKEEILKWREYSYAHTLCRNDYDKISCLPGWARRYLSSNKAEYCIYDYTINEMIGGCTGDDTWDAMQKYLVSTGELHNNVRMTWGKTVMHWGIAQSKDPAISLAELVYLNDRFALDGLSPPSYGGILWCYGWGDKPAKDGSISIKYASRYKCSATDFVTAEKILIEEASSRKFLDIRSMLLSRANGQRSVAVNKRRRHTSPISQRKERTLHNFFAKATR